MVTIEFFSLFSVVLAVVWGIEEETSFWHSSRALNSSSHHFWIQEWMRIIKWEIEWHFSHFVLHAWEKRKLHPHCPKCFLFFFSCWRVCAFFLYESRPAGTALANIITGSGICVCCIQSRACAYFWFLSVWEWENIHIAHLGSSWEPIELSYWKTPCCFFGRA